MTSGTPHPPSDLPSGDGPPAGGPSVEDLPADHPGFADVAYRRRRAAIAAAAERFVPGSRIPEVDYTAEEHAVWRLVSAELGRKHERHACAAYRRGRDALALPRDRVPQLQLVSERLAGLTGFGIRPVRGLVPTRTFYGTLADRCFCATQYVRHHSVPYYTPEPDIIHEVIGHANMLADPALADLYQRAGAASRRTTTPEALEVFSRVFWFSLEFGVVWEDGELRAYGAGLLSSYAEIEQFRDAEIRPLDIAAMAVRRYDIARYQPVLFAARSFAHAVDALSELFDSYDDDACARLKRSAPAA